MSHKGYQFESEIEDFFLELTGQTKKDPILKADEKGLIKVNRSFRIPTSGAMESMKGDILTAIPWLPRQFKVECKTRREKNKKDGRIFTLELDWVRKNNQEAKVDNQIPLLTFAFKGDTSGNRIWWLIQNNDYVRLTADLEKPKNLLYVACKTGIPNKKQDKLKFIHSLLLASSNESQKILIWNLHIDNDDYYLLTHNQFRDLMEQLRVRKNN